MSPERGSFLLPATQIQGFFSRWLVLPFPNHFAHPDIHLPLRLTRQAELAGLLRRAVAGLRTVIERREFEIPASVRAATAKFRTEADPLRAFIEDRVRADEDRAVARQEVYLTYTSWAVVNGFHPMSASRFYESIQMVFVDLIPHPVLTGRRKSGERVFRGIRLADN
jgi:putative DNA primase/helicase